MWKFQNLEDGEIFLFSPGDRTGDQNKRFYLAIGDE
jgi:hypothetical protein